MSEYRFTYDESFVIATLLQYRRQRKVYPWFIAVKIVCFLGLAALLALTVAAAIGQAHTTSPMLLMVALVPAFFILLLVLGPRLDFLFLKRRLKKSPFYDSEVHVAITDSGMSTKTSQSQSSAAWSAFTSAKRLASGFLLFSGPAVFYWLPDDALTNGVVGDVERALSVNLRSYESAAA